MSKICMCPKCGHHMVDEIAINAVVSTPFGAADGEEASYGDNTMCSCDFDHLECQACGECFDKEAFTKFGIHDSHPDLPRVDWAYEAQMGDTQVGYWSWVRFQLEQRYEAGCD